MTHANGSTERQDDYVRILNRLIITGGPTGEGDASRTSIAAVLDVETTGKDPNEDRIIELAARRFRFDAAGVITDIGQSYSWLEDPGRDLEPEIVRLTGLTDADLAGKCIDEQTALTILTSADVIIAHNAGFDRKFVEARLPEAEGLPWACSCREIDWPERGFDGRSLGWLLSQCGWFHDGHRAADDVDAVIGLLRHRNADGRTALQEMMESASTPGWIVRAVGANFGVKDQLKARGYRWDTGRSAWFKEVPERDRLAEEFWLACNVYQPSARPRCHQPELEPIDWTRRWR